MNLAEGSAPVLLEVYRVSVDPLAALEMISSGNDLSGVDMTSIIFPDFNQQTEAVFSYFGKLQVVNTQSTQPPQSPLTYNGRAKYDGQYQYRGK
ncbi:hypothetical protein B6J54_16125 [Klebsiella quasipneumoniae]|nr:hypothetical protein B6J54_16125 [Klebsiella quasipneumoniae]